MLVSIITPVYNAENFLPKCIASVLEQSYTKIELILINDGSTDKSKTICEQYTLADKRVKFLSQKNQGPAAARNTGVNLAQGDYIFFLDADDFIDKDSIKILINAAHQYQSDLVMGNFSKQENGGQTISQQVSFQTGESPFTSDLKALTRTDLNNYLRHFLKHPSNHLMSYCWARLYKTSIIKNNNIVANEKMRLFEDLIFNLEFLKHTQTTIFINRSIYNYVLHNNHISASMAVLDSTSLIHDMEIFHREIKNFLQQKTAALTTRSSNFVDINISPEKIEQEIGHALIHYAIIFIVRSCRQVNQNNRELIQTEISRLIDAPIIRMSLNHYRPTKGNSRLLPLLMKTRQTTLIIHLGSYKAHRRYGKFRKN